MIESAPLRPGKRRRLDDTENDGETPTRTAAERVLAISELLREIGGYLMRDRIDLLALGAVNKACRKHVLPLWVRHLDVPLSVADKRAALFGSNPQLLRHVKYLRLWDDIAQYRGYEKGSERDFPVRHLSMSKAIICILGGQTYEVDKAPRIDLAIRLCDVEGLRAMFSLFPHLMKHIVTLRIFPSKRDGVGDESESQPLLVELSRFVNDIQAAARTHQTSGILAFAYGFEFPAENLLDEQVPLTVPSWYRISKALSPTVRSLSLGICAKDKVDGIFTQVRLPQLRIFATTIHGDIDPSPLLQFLTANRMLEDITVYIDEDTDALSLTGTFPELRFCSGSIRLAPETVKSSQIVKLQSFHIDSGELAAVPELRAIGVDLNESGTSLICGQEPKVINIAHVHLAGVLELHAKQTVESIRGGLGLFAHPANTAITCLELDLCSGELGSIATGVRIAVEAGALPMLTELSLRYRGRIGNDDMSDDEWPVEMGPLKSDEISAVMIDLAGAPHLRVLRLGDGTTFGFSSYMMLDNHLFPPALEYFAWRDFSDCIPQYYRFVAVAQGSDAAGQASEQASHSSFAVLPKRGRLQRIPSIFHQPITRDGVWTRHYFDTERMATVLDHTPETPQFSLT
ncbi:hypothetical protein OC842_005872 [Tilletia horrida]|uniref:Uncharacterized protein n=1 Tax=Tilletia horrida TaxID=155126 RepID=A0AAN6G712_9BASI|nr:hypothetical protein OC842_005872 [Tilletia horrida]